MSDHQREWYFDSIDVAKWVFRGVTVFFPFAHQKFWYCFSLPMSCTIQNIFMIFYDLGMVDFYPYVQNTKKKWCNFIHLCGIEKYKRNIRNRSSQNFHIWMTYFLNGCLRRHTERQIEYNYQKIKCWIYQWIRQNKFVCKKRDRDKYVSYTH